ncbi:hypothetical protein BRADI_4g25309v3, partial [Brachypodium distachyon]
ESPRGNKVPFRPCLCFPQLPCRPSLGFQPPPLPFGLCRDSRWFSVVSQHCCRFGSSGRWASIFSLIVSLFWVLRYSE